MSKRERSTAPSHRERAAPKSTVGQLTLTVLCLFADVDDKVLPLDLRSGEGEPESLARTTKSRRSLWLLSSLYRRHMSSVRAFASAVVSLSRALGE